MRAILIRKSAEARRFALNRPIKRFNRWRRRVPTDLEILEEIYERYYDVFSRFKRGDPDNPRGTKNYVPIDHRVLAEALDVEPDIIFGRLYYHLDHA